MDKMDYSDIAPYRDPEVPQAIQELLDEYSFKKVMRFVYPEKSKEEVVALCEGITTVKQFQANVAYPAMKLMNKTTITELTYDGFDSLYIDKAHLFISNHRDIILDSAILNMLLHEHELDTTETAIGSNLLTNPTVRHLTKLNKNFTVQRNVPRSELYKSSLKLSTYIRSSIKERGVSIWLSQKEGRAKDGNDRTQQGLLKMLAMSNKNSLIDSFKELNIRPLSLSYEYDPCDVFKIQELVQVKEGQEYIKEKHEDLQNIIAGISQPKGRVHLSFGPYIYDELEAVDGNIPVNDQVKCFAEIIDRHIHVQTKLWPNNYVAMDLISGRPEHSSHYTAEDKSTFLSYMDKILNASTTDRTLGKEIFLKKYAFPALNKSAALASIV
jgi:hypothetical protein